MVGISYTYNIIFISSKMYLKRLFLGYNFIQLLRFITVLFVEKIFFFIYITTIINKARITGFSKKCIRITTLIYNTDISIVGIRRLHPLFYTQMCVVCPGLD